MAYETNFPGLLESSSQWDGFRHYSQPRDPAHSSMSQDRLFYGGTTKADIMDVSNHRIGLQHWAREGIAGLPLHFSYTPFSRFHRKFIT